MLWRWNSGLTDVMATQYITRLLYGVGSGDVNRQLSVRGEWKSRSTDQCRRVLSRLRPAVTPSRDKLPEFLSPASLPFFDDNREWLHLDLCTQNVVLSIRARLSTLLGSLSGWDR